MKQSILYKETQVFKWLLIISILLVAIFAMWNYRIWHPEHSNLISISSPGIFLLITLVLFYKLKITITKEKAIASFGIGIIKKTVLISDLHIEKAEQVDIPLL